MNAASGTAPHRKPRQWDGLHQLNNTGTPPAPVPLSHIIGRPRRSPQGRLRRRYAAGLSPVLDPPGPFATDLSAAGNRTGQFSTPSTPSKPAKPPIDTAPLLQG